MPLCVCLASSEPCDRQVARWQDWDVVFVVHVVAQRASKNRPAGTIETKTINVDNKSFAKTVIDDLLPAIEEKWPAWARKKVSIQMDNTLSHKNANMNAQLIATLEEMAARG